MTDIALITGASRGIGREVARQLAGHGLTAIAASRGPDRAAAGLRGLAEPAESTGTAGTAGPGEVRPLPLDVTDPGSIRAAATTVEAEYGRLDMLVNNAGVSLEHGRSPLEADVDTVRRTYETNVFGVIAVTQAFLPLLRRSPSPWPCATPASRSTRRIRATWPPTSTATAASGPWPRARAIVLLATAAPGGPTGTFASDSGPVRW
jgi:NAD(P)-dependent dehydrogenase (short-subunit alcohol dehydrogenase family)